MTTETFYSHESRELFLFITNNGDLYRRQHLPCIVNLCRKKAQRQYRSDLAVKLFQGLADTGAKMYHAEFGSPDFPWHKLFSVRARHKTAIMLRDAFETEFACNQYAGINPTLESRA